MHRPNRTPQDEQSILISGPLQGYFFGIRSRDDNGNENGGLFGFAFPDLGISFKGKSAGPLIECQYEGLIALLKFTDENPGIFKNIELEILTDSAVVNYQMNHRRPVSGVLKKHRDTAFGFRKKIRYKVSWVPSHENLALRGPEEMITIAPDIDISFDEDKLVQGGQESNGRFDPGE